MGKSGLEKDEAVRCLFLVLAIEAGKTGSADTRTKQGCIPINAQELVVFCLLAKWPRNGNKEAYCGSVGVCMLPYTLGSSCGA